MDYKLKKSCAYIEKFQIQEPEVSRLGYDSGCSNLRLKEAEGPGIYKLKDYSNSKPALSCTGVATSFSGFNSNFVDIESELRSLNYKNTKCDLQGNDPLTKFRNLKNTIEYTQANRKLCSSNTKKSRSESSITSIESNRFDFPGKIGNIHPNSYIGQNTRLAMKDFVASQHKKGVPFVIKDATNCFIGKNAPECSLFKKL